MFIPRQASLLATILLIVAARGFATPAPLMVCLGDSITAGYGVEPGRSYPDALQQMLDDHGYFFRVENRGINGATTRDAIAHLPEVLRLHPVLVVVAFGGGDAMDGMQLDETRKNLNTILTTFEEAHVSVLLAGTSLPPGSDGNRKLALEQMLRDVAASHQAAVLPVLFKDILHLPDAIQIDGIHPTAKGSEAIAETLMSASDLS